MQIMQTRKQVSKQKFKSLNKNTSQHMLMDDLVLSNREYKKLDQNISNLHNDYMSIMNEVFKEEKNQTINTTNNRKSKEP